MEISDLTQIEVENHYLPKSYDADDTVMDYDDYEDEESSFPGDDTY